MEKRSHGKETKRLLRKLVRLFDGQTKEYLLKYIDDVSELTIEEQNELAQELPARRLSAEILSDIQRIKTVKSHVSSLKMDNIRDYVLKNTISVTL